MRRPVGDIWRCLRWEKVVEGVFNQNVFWDVTSISTFKVMGIGNSYFFRPWSSKCVDVKVVM